MKARIFVTLKPGVLDPQGRRSITRWAASVLKASTMCARAS